MLPRSSPRPQHATRPDDLQKTCRAAVGGARAAEGWGRAWPTVPAGARPIILELVILLVLVLANGILAGAEIAVVAVRKGQLSVMVDEGSRGAVAVDALRKDPERFFATIQIGITFIGVSAGALGGHELANIVAAELQQVPWLARHAESLSLLVVVSAVSYLSLVLGELVPKSLALRGAMGYALVIGRPVLALANVLRPLVWFLTQSSNLVLRAFGDSTTFTETRLSSEELAQLVDEATKSGSVHPKAGEIALRALDFGDVSIVDVMVPRTRVTAIPVTASADEIRRLLLEESHSHFPVFDGTLDAVVGVISTNDVLALAWEKELIVIQDLLRPPFFVPETMRAVDVLRELQRQHLRFALVVDERGGTAGIVTLKDLLEELVGEIFGERNQEAPEHVRSQPDGSFIVPGNMPIRDANRELPFGLPEGEDWTTVGGLTVALAGRIPTVGDRVQTSDGLPLEVTDASPRRVRSVRVGPPPRAEAP